MRKIITLLILFTLFSCQSQQINYSDLVRDNLKGEIKTLKETYYESEPITGLYQDEDGYDDYKITGYRKGKIKGTDEYIVFKNSYNKNGIITEYQNFYNGQLSNKTVYVFNKKGQKIDIENYDFKENKFLKSQKYYSHEFTYKENEIINRTIFLETKKIYSLTKTNYNENGKIIEWSTKYFNTNSENRQTFAYDSSNHLIKITNYLNGNLKNTIILRNNKKGDKIEHKLIDNQNNLSKKFEYEYKYDNANNWIERITIFNEVPETITEREIEYFKIK